MSSDISATARAEHDPQPIVARPSGSVLATMLLATLSVVTAIGFGRVFSGWEFLAPMLVVVIAIHGVALALRLLVVPGYIAVPLGVVVLFGLIAWKYYPTTLSGPFPTSRTWDFIASDLQLSRDQFPTAVAPVAAVGGFVVAATAAAGVAALLSDAFAFRAYGRAEATVPTAVIFVFASALGVDNHRVADTVAWLLCALVVIAILRMLHGQTEYAWIGQRRRVLLSVLPLAVVLAGCAAFSGAVIGPRLPGAGAKGLVDTGTSHDVTQVLSPLVDIRSRLVNLTKTELFTVQSSEPHYWRAAGLPKFDGTTWGLPDQDLTRVSGTFAPAPLGSHEVTQRIHITTLGGNLVPAAYSPVAINSTNVYWVDHTRTLVVPDAGIAAGATYDIVSAVLDINPDMLRGARSQFPPDAESTALPTDFPDSVSQTARDVTADAATVYDKAIALQNWFQTTFTYDLTVQRGHSNNAILNFLRIRRGYCEQFSGAFAAMARSLGIPARVAVGFTQGDLEADGVYHVFGRNAHAWPEVWFDDIGWIAFEPTPGRGEPGAQAYTGVEPQQAAPGNDPNAVAPANRPAPAPTTTVAGAGPATTVRPDGATPRTQPADAASAAAAKSTPQAGVSPWLVVFAILLLGLIAWLAALPRLVHWWRARHRSNNPTERIAQSWNLSAKALGLLGLAPQIGETPLEHARRAARMIDLDRRTLGELAVCATAAIYGGLGSDSTVHRCDDLAGQVIEQVKLRLSPFERFITKFDPRRAGLLVAP